MKVEDIMNRRVEFIDPDASVLDAIETLVDKRIRSLVVKPEKEGGEHGIITIRDILFKCFSEGCTGKLKVKEIANKPLIYVEKDMDVENVVKLMKKFNIARVFVKEDGNVVGVVALMDLVAIYLI